MPFIYKMSQSATTSKANKTGHGAMNRQLAMRDKLIDQPEATGVLPVWKEVQELVECSSAFCTNQGFSCWRDPVSEKHHKLDWHFMDELVDYAEEGKTLAHHDDVPEAIRDMIYRDEEEETIRQQWKREASDPSPMAVLFCCGEHTASADGPNWVRGETQGSGRRGDPVKLNFPVASDEAPEAYCDWLCSQVTNRTWQEAYRLACKVTLAKGYDL